MPGKVLIADDSLRVQKELTELLKRAGIEAVTVSNGEHAVRKLPSVQPDVVLADIFMPVRDGYEVCDHVKSSGEYLHTRVLLLVSKMEPYDENRAKLVRADGKIEKPFEDANAVLNTIKSHVDKVLAAKPAPAAAPIDEFAAAVPVEEEAPPPEPEPAPEMFSTQPPPVTFESEQAPMGFEGMVGEEPPAAPSAPGVTESAPEVVDLSQATVLTTADELKRRMQQEQAGGPRPAVEEGGVDLGKATMLTSAEELRRRVEEERRAAAEQAITPTEIVSPATEARAVEKPELAEAWEMTGPQAGAPPVPAVGGFDSQWSGSAAEEAAVEEAPAEAAGGQAYAPEEFAAAMSAALGSEPAAAPPEAPEGPSVAEELEAAMPAGPPVDPALVDEVVERVLERLSPQVMETIAREIVRPLAEAIIREKLR